MLPSGLGRSAGRLALQPAAGSGLAQGHSGDEQASGRACERRSLPSGRGRRDKLWSRRGAEGQPQEHHNVKRLKDVPVCSWSSEVRRRAKFFLYYSVTLVFIVL